MEGFVRIRMEHIDSHVTPFLGMTERVVPRNDRTEKCE